MITIDLETRSDKDISKCGVYPYAESPKFDILLFSYAVDDGEVRTVDIANGEKIPRDILNALTDEHTIKLAHNVNFERVCLSQYLKRNYPHTFTGDYLSPRGWRCTMIHCRYLGLPSSLAEAGRALGIPEQKMEVGKALIKFFCKPYGYEEDKPLFHNPVIYPGKWELFKTYNKRDVEAEMAIERKLSRFPVPESVWEEFYLDQKINDRGILIDKEFVKSALKLDSETHNKLTKKVQELTGVNNPNSVYQLLDWLEKQGCQSVTLDRDRVNEMLKTAKEPVKTVLRLRQQLSRSSVKKYTAMENAMCKDNRARGMFSFYGASRTGRYAGRLIQLQNLPQNHISDLEKTRETVKCGSYEDVQILYSDVPDTLSQLIRTAFIPKPGCKFIVADFSAIEARVIAWLAGEKWRIDAFGNGEDIYCASASKMFGVPVEKHGVNGHLRQKGKIAELACGYGGSVGAMKHMGGDDLKLSDKELKKLVDDWRAASPNIVKLWYEAENAAVKAVRDKTSIETHGLTFSYESGFLFIELPSERRLAYPKPKTEINRFGRESLTYLDSNRERTETFGGKLVENIVQAVARDILLCAMRNLSNYGIVAHVHDEVILECDKGTQVDEICEIMARTPEWCKDLPLRADGYECEFYHKE